MLRVYRFPIILRKDRVASSNKSSIQYLNITRRSLFEDSFMLLVFEMLGLLDSTEVDELLCDCDEESRKITSFSRKL